MKKIVILLCFILLITCCVACDKQDKVTMTDADGGKINITGTNTDEDESGTATLEKSNFTYRTDIRYAEKYLNHWLSEAGIIYDDDDLVHLITLDEGDDLVLCYDPNCSHWQTSSWDSDPACMAAHYPALISRTAYYNGMLYMFVARDPMTHRIYVSDPSAAGRKLLVELPFYTNLTNGMVFKDDKVYYNAMILAKDGGQDGSGRNVHEIRLVEVSLADGSYRFITEASENTMNRISIRGDTMYIKVVQASDGGLRLDVLDLNTLEIKPVITREEWHGGLRYMDPYDEDSYFFCDKNTYEIGIRNIDGTIEEILIRGEKTGSYTPNTATSKGIFYTRHYDYKDEPAGTYFLDLDTGEVIDLTEVAKKYGLARYDEYYDVFISVPNGDDIEEWCVWSREKIFKEAAEGISQP